MWWIVTCHGLLKERYRGLEAGEGLIEEVRSELDPDNGFNWAKWRGSRKTIAGSGTSTHVALTTGWGGPTAEERDRAALRGHKYVFTGQTEQLRAQLCLLLAMPRGNLLALSVP